MHFADRLDAALKAKGNPICVGLDPRFDQLPQGIRESAVKQHGKTARAVAEAFLSFNKALLDALSDVVPVCKPQVAFYEEFGWEGMRAYAETIAYARGKGYIVISDAKRGDIGATALAYARAHLGGESIDGKNAGFDADALTVNPYMGRDTLEPFLEAGASFGRGIFVLVKTSNAGSGDLQDLLVDEEHSDTTPSVLPVLSGGDAEMGFAQSSGGKPIYEHVAEMVHELGMKRHGACGLSDVGAVVGATYPKQAAELREIMPDSIFLIPGYGAQGGTARDAAAGFRSDGRGAIVNNSRGLIFAYKHEPYAKSFGEKDFAGAARAAALKMAEELAAVLKT